MNLRARAAIYGIAGLGLAATLIFSGMTLGVITPATGVLSILLTDPPSVPQGVSGVYITYSNLALHAEGLGDSGWVSTGGQGTLDTLRLINLSQTISTGSVPAFKYDLVALTISSATIQYEGKNYSATANSGRLIVPIAGGLVVTASHATATLVDIQPTVLNLHNEANPDFVIATGAKALQVPPGEVTDELTHVGSKLSLGDRGWFESFANSQSEELVVSGLKLAPNSLSFSVKNTGDDPINIKLVIINVASPGSKSPGVPSFLDNSFVLALQPDGSLQLLKADTVGQEHMSLGTSGFQLSAGSSSSFSFSGTLTTLDSRNGVSSGATYHVFIVGSETLNVLTVTAA